MKIKVENGTNKVFSVWVGMNKYGVVDVIINTEKRWQAWATGGNLGGENSDDFIIDDDADNGKESIVSIMGEEIKDKYMLVTQEKDQLLVTYLPMKYVKDTKVVAQWPGKLP